MANLIKGNVEFKKELLEPLKPAQPVFYNGVRLLKQFPSDSNEFMIIRHVSSSLVGFDLALCSDVFYRDMLLANGESVKPTEMLLGRTVSSPHDPTTYFCKHPHGGVSPVGRDCLKVGIRTRALCSFHTNVVGEILVRIVQVLVEPLARQSILSIFDDEDPCTLEEQTWVCGKECCICLERPPNVIFLPCKHIAVCHECNTDGRLDKCPICRERVESTTRV